MKYYKLINDKGYHYFKKGVIYPEDHTQNNCDLCKDCIRRNPEDWREVNEIEYMIQEKGLPKAWYVIVNKENQKMLSEWRFSNTSDLLNLNSIVGMCYDNRTNLYTKEHNPVSCIQSKSYHFGLEITTEQFKKYILKQTDMKKEDFTIEGSMPLKKAFLEESKLKDSNIDWDDYLTSSLKENYLASVGVKYNKHFILPKDWNEAMEYVKNYWEEEFKSGDWIFVTKKDGQGCLLEVGDVEQIYEIFSHKKWVSTVRLKHNGGDISYTCFRRATNDEIKKVREIKVLYFGKVAFNIKQGDNFASTSYGDIPKDQIEKVIAYVKLPPKLIGYPVSIHVINKGYIDFNEIDNVKEETISLGIGCESGKLSELEEILKAFD